MNLTPVQREIITNYAAVNKWQFAALAAVISIESNGISGELINGKLEPIIRYEGHYFDKLCAPAIRESARKAGVSAPSAGGIKNPASQRDRWALLIKATKFDIVAAYSSVSYGVGQVMGSNWKKLGFRSVDELVAQARSGFEGQVKLMVDYINAFGLADELRNLDFSGFARGYNGSNFKKYSYDTKMETAYRNYGGVHTIVPAISGTLRLGSTGAGVRDVQALLRLAGYAVNVDGDFGPTTKAAVVSLQTKRGLKADGIVGPKTQEILNTFREIAATSKPGQLKFFEIPAVQKAAAIAVTVPTTLNGVKGTVQNTLDQLSPYSFLAPVTEHLNAILGYVTLASLVAGGLFALYSWRHSKKTDTGTRTDTFIADTEHDIDVPLVLPSSE